MLNFRYPGFSQAFAANSRKNLGRIGRRAGALCLTVCMLAAVLSGCGGSSRRFDSGSGGQDHSSKKDIVYGDWIQADSQDDFQGYIYDLDRNMNQCVSFWVDYEVDIAQGGPCDFWNLYVRSYGQWYRVANLYMPDGKVTQQITLDTPLDIDAITTLPDYDGDLRWDDDITVYNPQKGSAGDNDLPDADYSDYDSTSSGGWASGSWSPDTYHINNANVSALVLDTPFYDCEKLRVAVDVEMLHNTSCRDWKVYTWTGSFWKPVGNIYLPDGNGAGQTDITLDSPMTISYIAVVPKVTGSFSWNLSIYACDLS